MTADVLQSAALHVSLDETVPCGVDHDHPTAPVCSVEVVALVRVICASMRVLVCANAADYVKSVLGDGINCPACGQPSHGCWTVTYI